ncbi:MAG: hypothetical protein PHI15_09880 [Methanomicrobium sp.]|nr:hypothetical protein [Methanomicrobium sp.]
MIGKHRHEGLSEDEKRELRDIITRREPDAAKWTFEELINLGLMMIAGEQMKDDLSFLHELREKLKDCPLLKVGD